MFKYYPLIDKVEMIGISEELHYGTYRRNVVFIDHYTGGLSTIYKWCSYNGRTYNTQTYKGRRIAEHLLRCIV